jgi:hypothetical protein
MNREPQIRAGIEWLDKEMDKVREQMKRRPSKLRHFMDMHRQKKERLESLKYLAIANARQG